MKLENLTDVRAAVATGILVNNLPYPCVFERGYIDLKISDR
jgi:hypothetical protein